METKITPWPVGRAGPVEYDRRRVEPGTDLVAVNSGLDGGPWQVMYWDGGLVTVWRPGLQLPGVYPTCRRYTDDGPVRAQRAIRLARALNRIYADPNSRT